MLREVASTMSGLGVLALLYRIVFLEAAAAWGAAVMASLQLLACIAWVKLLEKRAPDTRYEDAGLERPEARWHGAA